MIKFFRKIRKQLLAENKMSTYLVYAIGEIVLVVIGILIALQINNWNERKQERQVEMEMLRELKSGLEGDLSDIGYNLKAHQRYLKSQEIVIKWLNSNAPLQDSLKKHFSHVTKGTTFLFNEGPYETVKQMGMRIISNKELRLRIQRLYDMILHDYIDAGRIYYDIQSTLIFDYGPRHFYGETFGSMEPRNVEKLRADDEYAYLLRTIRDYNGFYLEQKILPAKKEIESVIKLIDKELEKRSE
ncbi:MAG: DUF6090 family protein [Flavobacteriaceae bacterium]